MPRLAVIDTGTNTIHLQIVEKKTDGKWGRVFRRKEFVHLGEEGIECIGQAAFQRGLKMFEIIKNDLAVYEVAHFRALGTAALRNATNGKEFVEKVFENTGIKIQIIDGIEEARLIYIGTKNYLTLYPDETYLLIDIGGGSIEFIVVKNDEILWMQSFSIGVAVIQKKLQVSDPLQPNELQGIFDFLAVNLEPLIAEVKSHKDLILVGASGNFDVFEPFIRTPNDPPFHEEVPLENLQRFFQKIYTTSYAERLTMNKLSPERVKYLVIANAITDFVLTYLSIQKLRVSDYALKEGAVHELILSLEA
jgi:exopolyphosphatase/guanosine-5'-triphosphate,3'-diphosphate pyrophosphatase